MVLKVIGLGPKVYVKSLWNVFDAIIVISSILDYTLIILSL